MWLPMWAVFGLLVLLFIAGNLAERLSGRKFRAGWTYLVVGNRGGGKSLFVARLVHRRAFVDERPIVSNLNYDVPNFTRFDSWTDIILAPPRSVIIVDEAHQLMPATPGKAAPVFARWYNAHARKLEHELWIITQDEKMIAGYARDLVHQVVECEEFISGYHNAKAYAPREFRKAKAKPLWSWWYTTRNVATKVYDTNELAYPVDDERDSAQTLREKAELRRLIDEINERRASAVGAADPETMESAATRESLATRGDGALDSDGHDSTRTSA